ncbi:MAG: antitoxin, partial [Planctomycetota bacterium]
MQSKLTLRLDEKLIRKAKSHARRSGKSLSQLVAEYFALLDSRPSAASEPTPTVSKLRGVLRGSGVDTD